MHLECLDLEEIRYFLLRDIGKSIFFFPKIEEKLLGKFLI